MDRIAGELFPDLASSHRNGPDRKLLLEIARAADRVIDAIEGLAWAWSQHSIVRLGEIVSVLRDLARACAHALSAIEAPAALHTRLRLCLEREREARSLTRDARAWLLVDQTDPHMAIRGDALACHVEVAAAACARLRAHLERRTLA